VGRVPGFVRRFYWNQLRLPPIQFFIRDFDIFHSSDPFSPPLRKSKTIVTLHDLAYKKFPQFFERQVLQWDKFVRRSVQSADAVIVPSWQTKADVQEIFRVEESKLHVVRLPVSSIFSPQGLEGQDERVKTKFRLRLPFALFVGTLEPRKNIALLIRAFEMLLRRHRLGLALVLVGRRGWLYDEILRAIQTSPARESIWYLDYVSDRDLASLYRLAHFFLYLSHYEGYGFPVLEAMASGTPVVTSNSSSLREIAEGAGILVDQTDLDAIVEAMVKLTEDGALRESLSSRGLERLRQSSSAEASDKVLRLYRSLV
jgi:glycosyltransferase involved in cell wall biosynthesis